MWKKHMFIIVLFCIFVLLCTIFLIINSKGKPINPNDSFRLGEVQIIELSESANKGDGKAAIALANYYEAIEKDRENAARWLKLGADYGDTTCQWNYACYLEDINEQEQAVNYFKKAAANGHELAKKHLERMKITY